MRYKVNIHVLLWFLSSHFTIIMGNQEALTNSSYDKNHNANGTNIANTFLNSSNNHDNDNDDGGQLSIHWINTTITSPSDISINRLNVGTGKKS